MEFSKKVFIIAEAGVNHNGSLELALKMVDAASSMGVDAIKFQTFSADRIVTKTAPKAEYQEKSLGKNGSQYEMIKKLELSRDDHIKLKAACDRKGVEFMSTPFDSESVDLLADIIDVARLKIPSGEITNPLLLLKMAEKGKPMIMSTGMATMSEVETALALLAFGLLKSKAEPSMSAFKEAYFSKEGLSILKEKVSLLHCTTEYPASYEDTNLQAIKTLKHAFGLEVGLSDHTPGIYISIAAVARGSTIIEKHFTLDRNLPGPDHKASLEPNELQELVRGIRAVEKAIGSGIKVPASSEIKNSLVARKSLVALKEIPAGTEFSRENLGVKRPGTGLSPMRFWDLLGKKASKKYFPDEMINE
ncbi:MAG: N-acetylneuraminate synthase [Candidatus Riflebacteria bacterium]|nr:N-acetylneuraminate synthase [Candidatus Riflebacteria bacterium]